jgi:hypothetical protein
VIGSLVTPATRSTLLVMAGSVGVFFAAVAWGAVFAFPEPDASVAVSAQLQHHAKLSGALMLLSMFVFATAFVQLVWRWRRARAGGSCSSSKPE